MMCRQRANRTIPLICIGMLWGAAVTSAGADEPGAVPPSEVLTGLDVLQQDQFRRLENQRIGLITNHTGRNRQGVGIVQLLSEAENVQLTALFSPEHGFAGALDVSKIDDAQDDATGLTIYSLYGETRRPTADMLQDVDTLIFDIQDIGTRFYTYVSTMGEAMHAATEHHKRFVVLDRPNPINAVDLAGPMLDPGKESFVGFHSLPVRHGMTIGELALMFKAERQLELDLDVIACRNWERGSYWDATGLTWVNPSPNMRSLAEAILYPGIGLLETTNLSVGRGTDTPFEVIGAPWLDGRRLAAALRARNIPGAAFIPVDFTPDSSKYADELCRGVNITVTERTAFEPVRTGLEIAVLLRRLHPQEWDVDAFLRLSGNAELLEALKTGQSVEELMEVSTRGLDEYRTRRANYLLYPETGAVTP
jgi:uncharacterized protein YbbC (DUF1343 family)